MISGYRFTQLCSHCRFSRCSFLRYPYFAFLVCVAPFFAALISIALFSPRLVFMLILPLFLFLHPWFFCLFHVILISVTFSQRLIMPLLRFWEACINFFYFLNFVFGNFCNPFSARPFTLKNFRKFLLSPST